MSRPVQRPHNRRAPVPTFPWERLPKPRVDVRAAFAELLAVLDEGLARYDQERAWARAARRKH